MEKSEKEALRNEALNRSNDYWADRAKEWEEDAPSGSVVCAMKKILWGEYQSKDLDTDGTRRVRNYTTIIEAFREIVERVMELSAEEYDAIYSSVLNDKACISHAIRKIVSGAPSSIQIECMFDSKKILLRSVWPEYYAAHYSRPTIWEIFNAQGSLKSGLIRAGKPKYFKEENTGAEQKKDGTFSTAKKERKHTVNHGAEVDRIVYHAMKAVFSKLNITTEELFASLAEPKKSGWGSYGFVQVIEARECYQTPLDFYMLNSPAEWQFEHNKEYLQARENAHLPHLRALDIMAKAWEMAETQRGGLQSLSRGEEIDR